jgi:uncharacterized protein (UPF0332 family)
MTDKEKQDLINYRLLRAQETLEEVQILYDTEHWNAAINRLYYSCYYAIGALLIERGISTKTHSGIKQMFGQEIIVPGVLDKRFGIFYSTLFNTRQKGDYDDFVQLQKRDADILIPQGKELINSIRLLLD